MSRPTGSSSNSHQHALYYGNLTNCRVRLHQDDARVDKAPLALPPEVTEAAFNPFVLQPYDFALEKKVLAAQPERQRDLAILTCTSKRALQATALEKVKAVTKADEKACIKVLEQHHYNANAAIDAYFQSPQKA